MTLSAAEKPINPRFGKNRVFNLPANKVVKVVLVTSLCCFITKGALLPKSCDTHHRTRGRYRYSGSLYSSSRRRTKASDDIWITDKAAEAALAQHRQLKDTSDWEYVSYEVMLRVVLRSSDSLSCAANQSGLSHWFQQYRTYRNN